MAADPHAAAAAIAHSEGFFENPKVWVAIAFLIFVALVYKIAKKTILSALDGRAAQVRKQLDDATRLKAEAEQMLADAQRRHKEAVAEAQSIVDQAKDAAVRLAARLDDESAKAITRREESALEKIKQAEHAALAEVRAQAVDVAIAATRRLLTDAANTGLGPQLLEQAVADLPNRLN